MPTPVELVPNLSINDGFSIPKASPEAAAAPAKAFGEVAVAIGTLGGVFHRIGEEAQNADNQDRASNVRSTLTRSAADFQVAQQQELDPVRRVKNTNEFLGKQRQLLDDPNLPPVVRASLKPYFTEYADRLYTSTKIEAADLTQQKLRSSINYEYDTAEDEKSLRTAFDSGVAGGIELPENWPARLKAFNEKQADKSALMDATNHPIDYLKEHPEQIPAGEKNPVKYLARRDKALQSLQDHTVEQSKTALDGIYGDPPTITTPEQLKTLTPDLRPSAREPLLNVLRERASDAARAQMADPAFQKTIYGQFNAALADYTPKLEGSDEQWTQLASMAYQVPPGPLRDDMMRSLNQIRGNAAEVAKTYADLGKEAILKSYKDGTFGKIDGSGNIDQDVTKVVADGYLRDQVKLKALGFTDDQTKALYTMSNDDVLTVLKKISSSDEAATTLAKDLTNHPTDQHRTQLFRLLFDQRGGEATASPYDIAAAEAIREGKPSFKWFDPEQEDSSRAERVKAQDHLGDVLADYSQFVRLNPNAKPSEVEDHVYQLGGAKLRQMLMDSKMPSATPKGDKGASDNTAVVPVGRNITDVIKNLESSDAPGGFYRTAYADHGQWSIGYGTHGKEGEVIDKAEADKRLSSELSMHRKRVDAIAAKGGYTFTENQKDALTSFDFNSGHLETLLLNNGHRTPEEIAAAMLRYKYTRDGQALQGLVNRRKAEVQIFTNGYSDK